jgi:hypothetical protein
MSEVFFTFSGLNEETALPIMDAIERAGFSVSRPPRVQPSDEWSGDLDPNKKEREAAKCVVALWSRQLRQSPFMRIQIPGFLRAWSSNRLVLIVLDNAELPLGLRDLPAISLKGADDATAITELIDRVRTVIGSAGAEEERRRQEDQAIQRAEDEQAIQRAEDEEVSFAISHTPPQPEAAQPAQPSRRRSRLRLIIATAIVLVGLAILDVAVFERPIIHDNLGNLVAPEEASSSLPDIAIALVVGLVIGALAVWGWTVWSRRRSKPIPKVSIGVPLAALSQEAGDGAAQVFVSYSRQDGQTVDRLVDQIKKLGYTVWIDRQSTGSQRYAKQIVRAIRGSRLVALMCSAHAFTSDHVIREIYVAGDNKKPFIVFLLEPTEFPDEVLYFVSGFPRIAIASLNPEQLRSEITRLAVIA